MSSSPSSSPGSGPGAPQNKSGVITAGEWNDLDNWNFWEKTIGQDDFKIMPDHWAFFNKNRISVQVTGTSGLPAIDAVVKLKRGGATIFSAKTDNKGNAELWADLYENNTDKTLAALTLDIDNGAKVLTNVKVYKQGINKATISPGLANNKVEIAFVVDATSSMSDELAYLKTELLDVISQAKKNNPGSVIATSAVFYRDAGDEYVTKVSQFTNEAAGTINFIKSQSAGGGGDFPEAVHSALDKAVNELNWSKNAKSRILFLVLDAPPHHDKEVMNSIQASIAKAAEKGIKVIPVTASGINKETEFLMRFFSMTTNGTYVFITNHSGIGNDHLIATVGDYKVEFLNDLMVRLINKYAQ